MAQRDFRDLSLQLLWLLFNNQDFLIEFSDRIKPDYFGSKHSQYLVRLALEHWAEFNEPASEAVVEATLDADDEDGSLERQKITVEGVLRVFDKMLPTTERDRAWMWREAATFCRKQSLGHGLRAAADALQEQGPDAALALVDKARAEVGEDDVRGLRFFVDMPKTLATIGAREDEAAFVSTGLPKLDYWMGGGLLPSELAIFVAPTGRGKTMWLCSVASHALNCGLDVIYYTLEVPPEEIFIRVLASSSGVGIDEIRSWAGSSLYDPERFSKEREREEARVELQGQAPKKRRRENETEQGRKLARLRKRLLRIGAGEGKNDLYVRDIPSRRANVQGIVNDIQKLVRAGARPGLVLVDYADRLRPGGRHERRWEGEEEVYQDLASVAKEYDLPVWTAAQTSREALTRADLNLKYLKGAWSKAFEATFIVAAGQAPWMRRKNLFLFVMAKVRRGQEPSRGFRVFYDFSTTSFRAIVKDVVDEDETPEDREQDYSLAKTKRWSSTDERSFRRMKREYADKKDSTIDDYYDENGDGEDDEEDDE